MRRTWRDLDWVEELAYLALLGPHVADGDPRLAEARRAWEALVGTPAPEPGPVPASPAP